MILTREMMEQAIELVRPTALAILAAEGTIWGPKYVEGFVEFPMEPKNGLIPFYFGEIPKRWKKQWGKEIDFAVIAAKKLVAAKRLRCPTSLAVNAMPWLFKEGEYLYGGGTFWAGITVAVSGAKSRADEAIAEIVIATIVMLARLEADKRIAEGRTQI